MTDYEMIDSQMYYILLDEVQLFDRIYCTKVLFFKCRNVEMSYFRLSAVNRGVFNDFGLKETPGILAHTWGRHRQIK